LPYTDLLFVNQEEAQMLTGSSEPEAVTRSLRRHGVRDVIMKLGGEGCAVLTHEGSHYVPGVRVDVVDTTGAGDCFAGAFLTALYRGESYAEAARFANAVGAMAVGTLGAIAGVQSFEETMQWIKGRP
jgi:ribokinase